MSSSTCFFFHSHRFCCFCFLVVDILIRWRTHSINNSDSLIHTDKPYGGIMKSVETRQMGHVQIGDILHASHSHTHSTICRCMSLRRTIRISSPFNTTNKCYTSHPSSPTVFFSPSSIHLFFSSPSSSSSFRALTFAWKNPRAHVC